MSSTQLDASFDSNLLDRPSVLDRLRAVSLPAIPRLSRATLEFALLAVWAFTPFVLTLVW